MVISSRRAPGAASSARRPARQIRALFLTVAVLLIAAAAMAGPAVAGTANAGLPGASRSNPLAGMRWGTYTGPIDDVYPAYTAAHGVQRRLLGEIALRPLAYWFGAWYSDSYARTVAQQYIAADTGGNPDVLAQVTIFRMDPWEGSACPGFWSAADQGSYRSWVDNFAAGIGSARVALILQPDMPFAVCAHSPVPSQLVAYAAQRFNALRHTTVYIDAGAAEWLSPSAAAGMLMQAGIRHARGFALDVTQYGSTSLELSYGAQIVHDLAAAGISGKHFVVNTSQNGAPFLAGQYPGDPNNPRVCRNSHDTVCATLGIPPTWHTSAPGTGLSAAARGLAAQYADAYLWIGRPWLDGGDGAFDVGRALGMASSTPF